MGRVRGEQGTQLGPRKPTGQSRAPTGKEADGGTLCNCSLWPDPTFPPQEGTGFSPGHGGLPVAKLRPEVHPKGIRTSYVGGYWLLARGWSPGVLLGG